MQRDLQNWPLLRHLVLERPFRYAMIAGTLVVLTVVLGLPKIWIVTPAGVLPVVRVSLLNLLEARLYADLARQAEKRAERDLAFLHWRSAVSFNPADPKLLRGAVSNLLRLPARNLQRAGEAHGNSLWLLQLTRTNSADLDLVTDVCTHYGMDDLLLSLVGSAPQPLSDHQLLALVKTRLNCGDQAGFQAARTALPSGVAAGDPELPLFDAAAHALWDQEAAAAPGRLALAEQAATGQPAQRSQALRLQLLVALVQRRPADFAAALARLQDLQQDHPLDHTVYWNLLCDTGRQPEASRLALQFADPPVTPTEVMRLAEVFLRLGLTDHATRFLERFAPTLGGLSNIWLTYASLLIQHEQWDELRDLAIQIREHEAAHSLLGGFSYYLDGLAQISTHHTNEALRAFARIPQEPIREGTVVLWAARDLLGRGLVEPALQLLQGRETDLQAMPDYWQLLIRSAYHHHDADLLLRAAQRQFALRPDRLDAINDLAAALLICRRDPAQALVLTRQVLDHNPTSVAARLNQALALLQNGHPAAANALLQSLDESGLGEVERNLGAFAQTDRLRQENRPAEALHMLQKIRTDLLLPPQASWLDHLRAELEARPAEPR